MMECLKTFQDTTDSNHFISKAYVIPSIATFPSHLHGIKLGSYLEKARQAYHEDYLTTNQVDTLEKYQIHWEYETYKFEFISLPSLDAFKEKYGHFRVSICPFFVIPYERSWPENLWGVKLGNQVQYWQKHKDTWSLKVIQALIKRNFIWNVHKYEFQTISIPALRTYGDLKGNLLVPQSFRVPATSQ